jgi:hypothetical protein
VSELDDDLELEALKRQLDDAFETTRPRVGFDDELWVRMQARRPFWSRFRDSLSGLVQGVREGPAVPTAAVAALLVVVIGVGVFELSGLGRGSATQLSTANGSFDTAQQGRAAGAFGVLPAPALNSEVKAAPQAPAAQANPALGVTPDIGRASLTWAGQAPTGITSAPVYRYQEPSSSGADQFANSLGAILEGRPDGFLGSYQASDYTLRVSPTVQTPPVAPAYFILSNPSMPVIEAAGAAPADIASLFLAEHSLVPQWPYTVAVAGIAPLLKVVFQRQFVAPGYGPADLVDSNGVPYGLEVDLDGTQPVLASGPFPVGLDSATYPLIRFDQAVRLAVGSAAPGPAAISPAPAVQLTKAELVYVLATAGDHSFYEPAYLFSGTFQVGGVTYVKRVLVPAIGPA